MLLSISVIRSVKNSAANFKSDENAERTSFALCDVHSSLCFLWFKVTSELWNALKIKYN